MRAVLVSGALVAVAGSCLGGCAVGAGLDAEAYTGSDGASGAGTDSSLEASEARAVDTGTGADGAHKETDAGADASPDARSSEASSEADADAAYDAALESGDEVQSDAAAEVGGDAESDAGPDASDDTGSDAGRDATGDTGSGEGGGAVDAGLDAGPDVSADASGEASCSNPPRIAITSPSLGATITVHQRDPSTFVYAFSAHVDFPCAPMQSVRFDYVGPQGPVQAQEMVFASYADPFAQQTQVGGGSSSLAAYDGGQSTSSWFFSVTATDANNQTTVVQEPFVLVVSSH